MTRLPSTADATVFPEAPLLLAPDRANLRIIPFIWLVYASTRGSCAERESWWRGIYSRGIGFDGHAMSRAGLAAQFRLNLHQSLGP
jgi:hypothetical protein